jgi:hypothetical protein
MNDATDELDEKERIQFDAISDKALEKAACCNERASFTLGACTGLSVCDG